MDTSYPPSTPVSERMPPPPGAPPPPAAPTPGDMDWDDDDEKTTQAIELVLETVDALRQERGEEEAIWGSMVKQTLKRRRPGFSESTYGFSSFGELLEHGKLLRRDGDGGEFLHAEET